jgi:uncharacterized membrane protein YeaQ/YmgE (transglycosylase-associated protein family)
VKISSVEQFESWWASVGFLVLLAVGGVLGWVASIVARGDEGRAIAQYLATGIAGALIFGALTSDESLAVGLSAYALLAAMVGAVAFLVSLTAARARRLV